MIFDNKTTEYSILDLGFNKSLSKDISFDVTPELANVFTSGLAPKNLNSGELISTLEQQVGVLFNGKTLFDNTQTGYRLGIDVSDELVKFYIGNITSYFNWTGTDVVIAGSISATTGSIGGFDIGSDYIRDAADTFGLASTITSGNDVRFWAGDTFVNRDTAEFR